MMSLRIPLLQLLLLVGSGSASHFYGGTSTFTYKGKNPDGSLLVVFRSRSTFDGCRKLSWQCDWGNCGILKSSDHGTIDSGTNAPVYNSRWCETEIVEKRVIYSDQPFELSARSCCWVPKQPGSAAWALLTHVDLGRRSDTGIPNRSPDVAILPFLRVPENCPRTYKLMSFDPDADKVKCRYGIPGRGECGGCNRPHGFTLDEDSCTLQYKHVAANKRVFGFELVVEDFPQKHISLSYGNGSSVHRSPLNHRKKRQAYGTTTTAYPTTTTTPYHAYHTTTPYHAYHTTTPYPTTTPYTPSPPPYKAYTPSPPPYKAYTPTTTTPYPTTTQGYVHKTPLSKIPLQFSVLVDAAVPDCKPGVYLPKMVYPSPQDGERIQAEVHKVVEIRIKGAVQYGKIHSVLVSGPLNITEERTTHDEFVLRWKPTEHNLWNHYPICFAVESVTESYTTTPSPTTTYHHKHTPNHHHHPPHPSRDASHSGIYHSEMRCVIVDVREGKVQTNVICTEETMTVEVAKKSFAGFHGDNLHLSDPSDVQCNLQTHSNDTHIIGIMPLNACGTQIEEDDHNLIFRNSITAFDAYGEKITRKHVLDVQFYCQYPKKGNVTLNFVAHRKKVTVWDRGMGTFTYQFEFYPDETYGTMINPNTYPLVYKVGRRIYMQIEATTSVSNTVLFVETCRASPYDTPDYTPTYSIIENGCNVDSTVETHPTDHPRMFRFSLEAFKFIGMYPQVYITCSVLMCEAGSTDTRCSKGCLPGPWSNGHSGHIGRRRRDAAIQSQSHFVSQGPLRLTRAAEERGGAATLNLNLNLVFIAGCLLAAVAMISALVLYRNRRGTAGYRQLQVTDTESSS